MILAVLLLTSTVAAAENWQMVQDSVNGTRLIADVDSINVTNYTKDPATKTLGVRVHATMQSIGADNTVDGFISIIDVEECLAKQAGTLVNLYSDGSSKTFFWSARGNRMYDSQAQWLCAVMMLAAEETKKQAPAVKNKSKPKYTTM